jgi:hypothetical protein
MADFNYSSTVAYTTTNTSTVVTASTSDISHWNHATLVIQNTGTEHDLDYVVELSYDDDFTFVNSAHTGTIGEGSSATEEFLSTQFGFVRVKASSTVAGDHTTCVVHLSTKTS